MAPEEGRRYHDEEREDPVPEGPGFPRDYLENHTEDERSDTHGGRVSHLFPFREPTRDESSDGSEECPDHPEEKKKHRGRECPLNGRF